MEESSIQDQTTTFKDPPTTNNTVEQQQNIGDDDGEAELLPTAEALHTKQECPTCKQPCTKRSLVPAPQFDALVKAFKHMLRDFGLAPSKFDPTVSITQLMPDETEQDSHDEDEEEEENMIEVIDSEDDDEQPKQQEEPDGLTKLPSSNVPNQQQQKQQRRRRAAMNWMHVHEHVQVARTFARHLSGAASKFVHREQAAVVSVNERALVQAAVIRQKQGRHEQQQQLAKKSTRHELCHNEPSLSQQHREQAQEQQAADSMLLSFVDDDEEDQKFPAKESGRPLPSQGTAETSQDFFSAPESLADSQECHVETTNNNLKRSRVKAPPPRPESNSLNNESIPLSATLQTMPTKVVKMAAPLVSDLPGLVGRRDRGDPARLAEKERPISATTHPFPSSTSSGSAPSSTSQDSVQAAPAVLGILRRKTMYERVQTTVREGRGKVCVDHIDEGPLSSARREDKENNPYPNLAQPEKSEEEVANRGGQQSVHQPHLNENSPSRSISKRPDYFSVGSIVEVQSRTWPGANKPGGVGRVTRVHFPGSTDGVYSGASSFLYDVAYILGGKENKVESVFVSAHDRVLGRDHETGSLRIRFNNIPQTLLAQLEAEGFDTVGRPSLVMVHKIKKESTIPFPAKLPNKRLSEEPPNEAQKKTKKSRPAKPSLISGLKTALSGKRSKCEENDTPVLNDTAKCEHADEHYSAHFRAAVAKGVLYIAVSALSAQQAQDVSRLCTHTKKGPLKVKLYESFSKKINLCVVASAQESEPPHIIASRRTLKTMQATMAGIPLVSHAWIAECLQTCSVLEPKPSMYIRALPTKVRNGLTDFGVAHVASLIRLGLAHKPLKSCFVYLCGKYTHQIASDMTVLAKQAGAIMLSHLPTVLVNIRSEEKVVLLCNKTAKASLTRKLESEIRHHPKNVLIVTAQWLFDSTSSGKLVSSQAYPPECISAHTLWTITSATETMT